MKDKSGKVNLFAHPITFVLTHIVFPLFAVGALGHVYWLTVEALAKAEGSLGTKMLVALCASAAIPVAAVLRLVIGPKRIDVLTQVGFALLIVAFAYFAFPVMGDATEKVDSWIIGPTAFLSFFIGVVPPIFAGVARIATADWKLDFGADIGVSVGLTILGPLGLYLVFSTLDGVWRHYWRMDGAAKHLQMVMAHLAAVGIVLGTLVLFIGFLRLMHLIASRFDTRDERLKRIVTALVFGLALPWGGLALNLHIPFPSDFANPWPWVLSAVTTLAMIVETKSSRGGLALWFLKLAMAPFVLYFFLLFVPFLPLAVLAILAMGTGFLILAPTILFRYYTASVFDSWKVLRGAYSKARLIAVAVLGFLVIPLGFVVDVEIERAGLKTLVRWHTEEDFDTPPAPLPVSKRQAERIVRNANDFADGAEIPFLSAWRSFRVYDGMYMSDSLREELNLRILGKKLSKNELDWNRSRNFFGAGMFGGNAGRRSNRNMSSRWTSRPPRTNDFTATCESKGSGVCLLKVHAKKDPSAKGWGDQEFIAPFRLPAGTWIEGMRLKMNDGTWKDAKASERKAAEFVYRHITEQRRDPSIITLDTPTSGTLKIFPIGEKGRDVEITLRTTALAPLLEPIVIGEQAVRASVLWGGPVAELVTAKDAAVTLVSAGWMDAHTNELVKAIAGCDVRGFSLDDPEFKGDLRRHMRLFATTMATNAPGVMPSFGFVRTVPERRTYKDGKYTTIPATNEVVASLVELPRDCRLPEAFLTTIRRELPGVVAFGDRPLDGWYVLEVEDGGKVAVPYRKGEGALVFAKVKGATVDDGKWSEGAKLWVREREAFLKPALDLRQELLDGTRATGVLTTQSAYLAVETSAQEKALKQKEMEALYGNKAFDFEEPPEQPTSGDAPGLFLILGGFLVVLLVRRKWHAVCAFCLVACAASSAVPLYPKNAVNRLLKEECARRGIVLTDWHLHIRGGMTPEVALQREQDSGIRSTAMENHGREWEAQMKVVKA